MNIGDVCRSLGVPDIHEVDPYDYRQTYEALRSAVRFEGVSVIIAARPCWLFPKKSAKAPFKVLEEACNGCGTCLSLYCPSIVFSGKKTAKGRPKVMINTLSCNGCSFCAGVCANKAIVQTNGSALLGGEQG